MTARPRTTTAPPCESIHTGPMSFICDGASDGTFVPGSRGDEHKDDAPDNVDVDRCRSGSFGDNVRQHDCCVRAFTVTSGASSVISRALGSLHACPARPTAHRMAPGISQWGGST
eukprot:CAMPEP_0176034612 /NCGR_PEP_ID=MMETSP0120_2-20121206/17111_1 /TAXON_ID=160619 /ORGANISM="Kryptoperidinium foliaceum, Strain CCMP 1326" /LENGTH=114 /DNA_ID=CAMNT_0017367955 /DNA_START=609 /DNA_END=950 /DNA_ORIENTATION=-